MDSLVTLIGNAAVDPIFRKRFLDHPVDTADQYGFRFTKGDFQMMEVVFAHLTATEHRDLEGAFKTLQDLLHKKVHLLDKTICGPPCKWSIYPPAEPHELREEWLKAAA